MAGAYDDWVERARAVPIENEIIRRHIKLRRSGAERIGPCPRCGGTDRFSINVKEGVWHCRQCKPADIPGDVIGLVEWLDGKDFHAACELLAGEPMPVAGKTNGAADRPREVAWYDYTDDAGKLVFQVVRFEPKDFRQRKPLPGGGWDWSVRGVAPVPYNLPALNEAIGNARTVYVVEGEKDVHTLDGVGVVATCNAGGAGKWRPELTGHFTDADVVIIGDHDPQSTNKKTGEKLFHPDGRPRIPGRDHAMLVAEALKPVAFNVRAFVINELWPACPPKGDVTDYFEAGGTIEALNDYVAKLPSWSPEQAGALAAPRQLPFLSKADFLRGFTPPDYLIEGMLQRRFVYSLTGQTGHAKTAIALLLAELVASTDPNAILGSHKIDKGRVVYFVGENPDDIRMRVIGNDWQRAHDGGAERYAPGDDRIHFIPGVFNIKEMYAAIKEDVQDVGGADLIIVDTSAAYFLGNEELSNTEMNRHAKMLRDLSDLPGGPCVLVLCHPIKHAVDPSQLLPRGGGAFLAEMDGNLTIWKHDDQLVQLSYTKMRGAGFEPMTFKLERIEADSLIDRKGRRIPTVRAVMVSRAEEDQQQTKTRADEDLVLARMVERPERSLADLAEACGWFAKGEPAKSRVQSIVNRMKNPKEGKPLVKMDRGHYVPTDRGKEVGAKALDQITRAADNSRQLGMNL